MTDAQTTFARRSDAYARARPRYPAALYDWIISQCQLREAAWDCATGNGQAAVDLARHFTRVYASDISPEQVKHGEARPNIIYSTESAERTSYADNQFDLVAVAQALHWFDYDRFWPEVSRVAKPGALFCGWGYAWFESDREVDRHLVEPFREVIAPYWAPNNVVLWRGYQSDEIAFPFERLKTPAVAIELEWEVPQLVAYMQTWSAYKRALENEEAAARLAAIIGAAAARFADTVRFAVRMPLASVAGRVPRGSL